MMHGSFKNIIHFPQRLSLKGKDHFYTIEMASIILRAEAVLSENLNICKNSFDTVGCVHMSFLHVTGYRLYSEYSSEELDILLTHLLFCS